MRRWEWRPLAVPAQCWKRACSIAMVLCPSTFQAGNLGCGYTHDLSGLRSVLELVLQLRGTAGTRQLESVSLGLAQSWRGTPAASGGVAILEAAR